MKKIYFLLILIVIIIGGCIQQKEEKPFTFEEIKTKIKNLDIVKEAINEDYLGDIRDLPYFYFTNMTQDETTEEILDCLKPQEEQQFYTFMYMQRGEPNPITEELLLGLNFDIRVAGWVNSNTGKTFLMFYKSGMEDVEHKCIIL